MSLITCGCSKDERLVGDRIFGVDHYAGTYKANYKCFSHEEILF